MADVLDILQITKTPTNASRFARPSIPTTPSTPTPNKKTKKNKDLPRELRALAETNKFVTLTPVPKPQFKEKRTFKEPVKPWSYSAFQAIDKGPILHHWERAEDTNKEYAFKELNKKIRVFKYSNKEYEQYLQVPDWTRQETDELFAACEMYDLRWPVIRDRISVQNKTMEQCKLRYYSIAKMLLQVRATTKEKKELAKKHPVMQQPYDYEEEVKRKQQMDVLYTRGMLIDQKEQWLREQVKKIEAIKKKRADEAKAAQQKEQRKQVAAARKQKREKVLQQQQDKEEEDESVVSKPEEVVPELPVPAIEDSADPFLLNLCINTHVKPGVKLRSQLMKPAHNKLSKRVDLIMNERKLFTIPDVLMATKEIHEAYNELRTKIGVYLEVQKSCLRKELELQRAIGARDSLREQLGLPATVKTPPMLPPPSATEQTVPQAVPPASVIAEQQPATDAPPQVVTNEDDEKTYQRRGKKRTNSASAIEVEPSSKRRKN